MTLATDVSQSTPLFDWGNPPILMSGDTPRVRRTDPITSHLAGDSSSRGLVESMRNILILIRDHGPLVGSELNSLYAVKVRTRGWKRIAADSARKRAGELARRGYLVARTPRVGLNADPETAYELTIKGLEAIS